jgi:hypothetical protein
VLSGRGPCDEMITRPEESYRLWCVVVCDLETSGIRKPWPTGGCCAKRKKERNIPLLSSSPSPSSTPPPLPPHKFSSLFAPNTLFVFPSPLYSVGVQGLCFGVIFTVFILFFAGFSQLPKPYYEISESLHHSQNSQFLTRLQIPRIQNCHLCCLNSLLNSRQSDKID